MTKNKPDKKKCFVICPISEPKSAIRRRSDLVLKYIIKPVTTELGYITTRSDEDSRPGIITSQIISRLISDELVIADLSSGNPNVYYELAVRHIVRKPVVQIIHYTDPIHFDIITQRTIRFDYQDLESAEYCRQKLKEQIQSVEKNPIDVDSPISTAIDTKGLLESQNPVKNILNKMLIIMQNMQQQIDNFSSLQSVSGEKWSAAVPASGDWKQWGGTPPPAWGGTPPPTSGKAWVVSPTPEQWKQWGTAPPIVPKTEGETEKPPPADNESDVKD